VEIAALRDNHDKNFIQEMFVLVNEIARLAGLQPPIPHPFQEKQRNFRLDALRCMNFRTKVSYE
jgi:hypothetical protein